jgi:hypothetical protein
MKFKSLSEHQRIAWYCASAVFGICLAVLGFSTGAFANGQTFALILFAVCWLAGVLLLRLFLQQFERPADIRRFLWGSDKHTQ